jgi:hypothetical protein
MKSARLLLVAGVALGWGCSRTGLHGRSAGDGGPVAAAATGGAGGSTAFGTGGTTQVATTTGTGGAGSDAAPVGATVDCFIAIRTDTCCPDPFVTSHYEIDDDPCVQPYERPTYRPECTARWPTWCTTVDCAYIEPLTRVVGRGANGACQYLTECDSDDDCLRAIDARDCCGCPGYYPRALVAANPCLKDPVNPSGTDCTNPMCASVRCDNSDAYCPHLSVACTASAAQAAAGLKACVDVVP